MFFTYLWRELRRRARQAIFIAIGLALGIGLVITVTAAAAGVKNAQASVLHSLYGVGTDITVTKAPSTSSAAGGGFGFSFKQGVGTAARPKAGSTIDDNTLASDFTLSSIGAADVTSISFLVGDNPTALAAFYRIPPATTPGVANRLKMAKTSNVIAIVEAGGKLYSATKEVKVTVGGCGG